MTALLTSALLTAGCVAAAPEPAPAHDWSGVVLDQPLRLPSVTLTDTSGAAVDLRAGNLGVPTLLFFGYTTCPDVCPVHLATIARAKEHVGLGEHDLHVVMVTVDPDRDQPEVLRRYLDRFDPSFQGLWGDHDTVAAVLAELGLPAAEFGPVQEDGAYFVGHPAQVIAFGPDGDARVVYPFGVTFEDWVADLPHLAAGEQPAG